MHACPVNASSFRAARGSSTDCAHALRPATTGTRSAACRLVMRSFALVLLVLGAGCAKHAREPAVPVGVSTVTAAAVVREPLSSWRAGDTKQAIIDFVTRVSTPGSPSMVAEQERIAVFGNDGTLWPEKPLAEAAFTISRLKAEVVDDPLLAQDEPYASILAGDVDRLSSLGRDVILNAIARTHSGMTDEAFELGVHTFLLDARHPVFGVPYPALAYRPMRELIEYLRDHRFDVYLCTSGDQGFARAYVTGTYGIPRDHVIGSTFAEELVVQDGQSELRRLPRIASLNDGDEKAANIQRTIGRRPLFAAGDVGTGEKRAGRVRSGGDIAMLTYARGEKAPSLAIVVHHDDAERELAYDEPDGATLEAARQRGFVVVSMRKDWAQIFDEAPPPWPPRPPAPP